MNPSDSPQAGAATTSARNARDWRVGQGLAGLAEMEKRKQEAAAARGLLLNQEPRAYLRLEYTDGPIRHEAAVALPNHLAGYILLHVSELMEADAARQQSGALGLAGDAACG